MSMTVEDVKIVYVPDAKSGQQLLNQWNGVVKKMDDYMVEVGKWVGKVNNNLDTINKAIVDSAEDSKTNNENIVRSMDGIQKEIGLIQTQIANHMTWHAENGSVWKKIFGK